MVVAHTCKSALKSLVEKPKKFTLFIKAVYTRLDCTVYCWVYCKDIQLHTGWKLLGIENCQLSVLSPDFTEFEHLHASRKKLRGFTENWKYPMQKIQMSQCTSSF